MPRKRLLPATLAAALVATGCTQGSSSSSSGGSGSSVSSTGSSSGGTGGASSSSSSGTGGAPSSSSSGTGGGPSSSSSGSLASATSSGSGLASASASSSGGTGGASSSSGSGGADGGASTCGPPGGESPGQVVWATPVPLPCPFDGCATWSSNQLAVSTSGNLYTTLSSTGVQYPPIIAGPPAGVFFAALDSAGAILAGDEHTASNNPMYDEADQVSSYVSVVGASNYVFEARFVAYAPLEPPSSFLVPYYAYPYLYTHTLAESPPSDNTYPQSALVTQIGFRDLAGDTFILGVGNVGWPWAPGGDTDSGFIIGKLDPTGAPVWSLPLPETAGPNSETAQGIEVAPDTGSVYISAELSGTVDLGCGDVPGSGYFASEIDAEGSCVWSQAAGTSTAVVYHAGAYDYLLGNFDGSLDLGCGAMLSSASTSYLAVLDASTGLCMWSNALPGVTVAVTLLPSGEPLLTGAVSGTADLGCGTLTGGTGVAYVAKLDTTGACVWSRTFAGGFDIVPFASGDLGVAVGFTGSMDFGCGALTAAGTQDSALGRLAGDTGACVWSKSFGAAGAQVALDQAGTSSALGYLVAFGSVNSGAVDFGGGPLSSTYFALEVDGSGTFRFGNAVSPLSDGQPLFAVDPCGYPITVTACATCGPSSALGETVTKLAP